MDDAPHRPLDERADVERLLDERAIVRCLHDYCRGIDRGDATLVASVYHPDAIDDHGSFQGLGEDFATYAVTRLNERYQSTQHSISNTIIDFAGPDVAHVESHVLARQLLRTGGDHDLLETFGGRYVDRFERRDGVWKIADRLVVHEWDKVEEVTPAFPAGRFTEGVRGPDDPSSRRAPAR